MQPKFLYFDLGNVLVTFSVERMLRQLSNVTGRTSEELRAVLHDRELLRQHERGDLSTPELYETFCAAVGCRPDYQATVAAVADIFEINWPLLPLVAQLRQAGHRMGILSNTGDIHWQHCCRHYRIVTEGFSVHALSYRIGALKPEAAIFQAAAELAGVRPEEIFFTDDLPGHVAGARAAGFDAVQFTTAAALAADLRARGLRFNY